VQSCLPGHVDLLPADVHLLRHGLDDNALAALLGCAPSVLTQLRLCWWPSAALPLRTAEEDVTAIAERFGIDAGALRRVVEEAAVKDP
jgi:hypothetical protein